MQKGKSVWKSEGMCYAMTLCVSVYVSIYGEIIESNRDYRGSGNMINPHSHSFSLRGHITPLSMLLIGLISSAKHYVKDTIPPHH